MRLSDFQSLSRSRFFPLVLTWARGDPLGSFPPINIDGKDVGVCRPHPCGTETVHDVWNREGPSKGLSDQRVCFLDGQGSSRMCLMPPPLRNRSSKGRVRWQWGSASDVSSDLRVTVMIPRWGAEVTPSRVVWGEWLSKSRVVMFDRTRHLIHSVGWASVSVLRGASQPHLFYFKFSCRMNPEG